MPDPNPPSAHVPRPAVAEIGTVARHEFRALLLSWRALVPMCIYAGFGALSMLVFVKLAGAARDQYEQLGGQAATGASLDQLAEETVKQVFKFTGWGTEGDVAELFRDQVPLLVIVFFALASYFLPLLVALVTFDQFSELSTRGARFALLRVRRLSYVAGKALAAAATVSAFLLAMWIVVIVVTSLRGGAEVAPHAVREGLRGWALMTVLSLPYLSLTALVSSVVRPGMAFVSVMSTWVLLTIGSFTVGSLVPMLLERRGMEGLGDAVSKLVILFPWESAPSLISRHGPTLAGGVATLLLLAAAGYALTGLVVRRRDV